MKVGVLAPIAEDDWNDGTPSYAEIRRFALDAEAAGLDSLWIVDHVLYRFPDQGTQGVQECWTTAAALAEATTRIELGTLVVCTEYRNPALLAKMAVNVDALSGGRLTLGLGSGWHDPEYEAFGYPTDYKVSRFEESVQIIAGLLDGEHVTLKGRFHSVADAELAPPPERRVPILVAAFKPRMLELTARYADAFNSAWYGLPDERLAEARAELASASERVGRGRPIEQTVGVFVHYPDLFAAHDRGGLTGSAAEIAEGLAAHEALGAEHVIVWLVPGTPEALERFAEAVRIYRDNAGS